MSTLMALVVCLAGGMSAVVGTIAVLALLAARRLRGAHARLTFSELRTTWGVSALIGIPLLFRPLAEYVVAHEAVVVPYLYTIALVALTAGVSAFVGTMAAMAAVALWRFAGFRVRPDADRDARWPMGVGWVVSVALGLPLLTQRVSTLVEVLANR